MRTSEDSNVLAGTGRVSKSIGDEEGVDPKERVAAECQEASAMCEWSHIYDESEWSLMISLIRRLG